MVYDSKNAPSRPQRRDTPSRAARMPSGASLKGEVVVKIVTDSVASIPAEVVRARDIEVVSLFVNRDGREYREADMDVDAFYEDIADMIDNPPTSSQPSQHAMETIFEKAAQAADEVLGVFISSKMSGTFEGAVRSARACKERYKQFRCTLIDSTSNCGDEMFAVLDACDARDAGGIVINGNDLIDAQKWYQTVANGDTTPQYYTYSATNVRLQEASIGYTIPRKKLGDVCDITLSIVGRNLWMLYNKAPFDPEAVATTSNYYQGIDYFMMPSLRSIGFNVRVKF